MNEQVLSQIINKRLLIEGKFEGKRGENRRKTSWMVVNALEGHDT